MKYCFDFILCVIIIIIIILILIKCLKNENFGPNVDKHILNYTLKNLVDIFNKHNINGWFIGYGTLLGIIRENSCIDKDDDIDILINKKYINKIIKLLQNYNYDVKYHKSGKFYKIKDNNFNKDFLRIEKKNYAPIDFYLCDVINGDYHDNYENIIWKNCEKLIHYKWNNVILNLPNEPQIKLKNIYGDDWKIPKKSKGVINNYNNKNPVLI